MLLNPQVNTGVRPSSLRERAPDRRRALSAVGGRHHRDTATLSSRSNGSGRTMRSRKPVTSQPNTTNRTNTLPGQDVLPLHPDPGGSP